MSLEQQEVLWLYVSMYHPASEMVESRGHIPKNCDRRLQIGPSTFVGKELAERSLGKWHDDHKRVIGLAAINNRDHISRRSEIDEEELPVSPWRLGNELRGILCAGLVVDPPYDAEPAVAELVANLPPLRELDFHALRIPACGVVIERMFVCQESRARKQREWGSLHEFATATPGAHPVELDTD